MSDTREGTESTPRTPGLEERLFERHEAGACDGIGACSFCGPCPQCGGHLGEKVGCRQCFDALRSENEWLRDSLDDEYIVNEGRLEVIARLAAERDAARADAARWRALMDVGRVRIIGGARQDQPEEHLGIELWGEYPWPNGRDGEDARSRAFLARFVDMRRALNPERADRAPSTP